jgi:hypothetical protein
MWRPYEFNSLWLVLLVSALCVGTFGVARAQSLESALMPGQVIRGHAKNEEQCKSCHAPFNKAAQDGLCVDCHKDVAVDLKTNHGLHGKQTRAACRSCHTDHKGRDANIASFDKQSFRHDTLTEFKLDGAHKAVKCITCHLANKKYRDAPKTCVGCHQKDDTHKGGLGLKCESCHGAGKWSDVRFDHNKETKFELQGSHVKVKCATCHVAGKYKGVPTTCVGCHRKDDKHRGTLGDKCESCHGVATWKTDFNHDTDTKFALRGKHRTAKCDSCHTSLPTRVKLPTTCFACHKADDKHQGSLGTQCADCHTERKWTETRFDHSTTRFKLEGKHVDTECKACHTKAPNFKDAPTTCIGCHLKDDKHKGTLGKDCETCHTAKDKNWRVALFDHERTKFSLLGKHRTTKCGDCHSKPDLYRNLPLACLSCHKKDDTHKGDYGDKCETCHNAQDWKKSLFDHNKLTKFALAGGHAPLACVKCHTGPLYTKKLETTCLSCHQKDDVHKGELGKDCATCHSDRGWKHTRFDHNKTKFPLTGGHRVVKCADCHTSASATVAPRYRDAPSTCIGCHKKEDVHERTLGDKCESCHVTRSWAVWTFDHDRSTQFLLDGGHKKVTCAKCHTQPLEQVIGAKCDGCHSRDDVHAGSFGRRCEQCHVTSDWRTLKLGTKREGTRK